MTNVFVLNPQEGRQLSDALHNASYEFRNLQHAVFQARGEGVVVSLYKSGKLVVQGKGAEAWHTQYLGAKEAAPSKKASAAQSSGGFPPSAASIGSDEAGKGDTFGPLVVAAVAIAEDKAELLQSSKVADSKTIDDQRIRILGPWIRENFDFEVRCLMPAEYNQEWQTAGSNVNTLLTQLHFDCLHALQSKSGFSNIVVDRFAPSCPVSKRLHAINPNLNVVEVPRAEAHLAVAAASVLAREQFLIGIEELSSAWAMTIPRGSGSPVPPALREFLQMHSAGELSQVAKVHFKNVQSFLAKN
ncbi:MAG: ribonuclease HIII [Planctomycetota bacterium]|nr:ribonuclease HIII [Planctomycetota bacterium]MDA1113433.1 ribonuclease HIII [Planctomycetota bacterium]